MTINLDGLLAGLIFMGMIGISVLLMIIAIPIRFVGKNKRWFMKLSMSAISFFSLGIVGIALIYIFDGHYSMQRHYLRAMDSFGGWTGLGIALALCVFIFIKKKT